MPSPFPGMDPYLEDPVLWPGVHHALITYIRAALNHTLPKNYAADSDERVYIETDGRDIYPDISVLEKKERRPVAAGTAHLPDPSSRLTVHPVRHREPFVKVLALGDEQQVVAIIEVLSPTNKRPGSNGRQLYVDKQQALLESEVHLIEVDLLRAGAHTVAVPHAELEKLGRRDYLALLHHAEDRWSFEAWINRIRDRLPRIWVPLKNEHPGVTVDLQACFERVYDDGGYDRLVDYRRSPVPELAADDAEWADALLRERGLRS